MGKTGLQEYAEVLREQRHAFGWGDFGWLGEGNDESAPIVALHPSFAEAANDTCPEAA